MAHNAIRAQILAAAFPCVGAKSAVSRGAYWFGLYEELGSEDGIADLVADLAAFLDEGAVRRGDLASFIASFRGPRTLDEARFEDRLWRTLQLLHDADGAAWDPSVRADPTDDGFAFSFGGQALFVVGMHAASSRWSRRTAWPSLVFNPHAQFRRLRASGQYDRLRDTVRARDRALQGSTNPMLADFGESSEARQYSGREVGSEWRCPFHAS
jgi:FPC/CPF motif-containing protein YcgG